jgi:hypothetical protein
MNWYVKYEGTGEVSGPMSEGDALSEAELTDVLVFNENIFSPKFVTTEEVDSLLLDMKKAAGANLGVLENPFHSASVSLIQEIMQRAIDTIILLSRAPTSERAAALITDLETIESVWSDMTEPGREADVVRRAISMITLLLKGQ